MKVLLTGHRGYIGVEMVAPLLKMGHVVTGLDIDLYRDCDFGPSPEEIPRLEVDLRDVEAQHLHGFDAVLHLAALSNDPLGDLDPRVTYDINLDGSVRIARAARAAGVPRYIFASSCSLYGAADSGYLDESAAFNPVTPYGESKIRAEQEIARLADDSFSPVFLRNATAYGVSRRLRLDIVVNNLVGYAVVTGKVMLQSDGTPWRPLVHIRDIGSAFLAALQAPREAIHNQAFNIGRTSENFQIRDVARLVAEIVPGCEVAFAPGASPDARNYRVSFAKAEEGLPGYEPRWTLAEGIKELYAAYRERLSREGFEGSRYFRLRRVRELQQQGMVGPELRPIAAVLPGAHR